VLPRRERTCGPEKVTISFLLGLEHLPTPQSKVKAARKNGKEKRRTKE